MKVDRYSLSLLHRYSVACRFVHHGSNRFCQFANRYWLIVFPQIPEDKRRRSLLTFSKTKILTFGAEFYLDFSYQDPP